jgi:FkbM family methyltransferase
MNYDFIEIGTSKFGTAIEEVGNDIVGMSIEPLQEYLDLLPNPNQVIKVCGAVLGDETYKQNPELELFYVPNKTIESMNLGWWIAGCNSMGKPHAMHQSMLHLVKTQKVNCYTFEMLAEKYNIEKIGYLQIDTEGGDVDILNGMLNYYEKNNLLEQLPSLIKYESNQHTDSVGLKQIAQRLTQFGYIVKPTENGEDTIATKETPNFIPKCFY